MRRWIQPLTIAALLAVLGPVAARAAGYSIYEQGAAVLGMAGAGTASVHDASALFFNPAALTELSGTHVMAGANMLSPTTSFAGMNPYPGYGVTEEMNKQNFFPPTVYITHQMKRVSVGAGFNSPFGLGVDWKNPDTFTGNYIVTKGTLTTYDASIAAAYAVNPRFSFALGGSSVWTGVELNQRIYTPVPGGGGAQAQVAKLNLKGKNTAGYGWNAAMLFRPDSTIRVGAYYRSKVVVHEDGDATFTQIPSGDPTFDALVAASLPPNQGVSTVLRLPAMWSAGVAWSPSPPWTVEYDLNYVEWSAFSDLPIEFKTTPSASQTRIEDYSNSWQVRLGVEHRLPSWTYRFGWYYDKAAAPRQSVTPLLPDADRNGPSLGVGVPFGGGKWQLDAYELAIFVSQRSTDGVNRDGYDGTYKTFVNAAGASLEYRF
jgi:long-chain fatty acid transport protein